MYCGFSLLESFFSRAYLRCQKIVRDNKILAGGKIDYIFSAKLSPSSFKKASKQIDYEYDKCCKQLGIPVRTLYQKYCLLNHPPKRILLFLKLRLMIPASAILLLIYIALFVLSYIMNWRVT